MRNGYPYQPSASTNGTALPTKKETKTWVDETLVEWHRQRVALQKLGLFVVEREPALHQVLPTPDETKKWVAETQAELLRRNNKL